MTDVSPVDAYAPVSVVDAGSVRTPQTPMGTVGIACRDFMATETVLSIYATDWSGIAVDFLIHRGNVLTLQRNTLVARMRGDWIIFIDDDMVWSGDALKRLIQSYHDLCEAGQKPDVLGALCFRRAAPFQPTLYVKTPDGPYNYLEDWEGRYIEVDATGMAFCLITKECFERIAGTPMPPFEDRLKFDRHPDFFRWQGALGEDLRFCEDVRKAGGRIIIDTDIQIDHISESRRGYRDFLRELATREEDVIEARRAVNDKMDLVTVSREEAQRKLDGLG
jgi:glycosyltransferase involved in cell wall biosynthesis